MNVEIGTEAAQFPEKEHINGIFLVVRLPTGPNLSLGVREPATKCQKWRAALLTGENAA
jgi:hypothetical protein